MTIAIAIALFVVIMALVTGFGYLFFVKPASLMHQLRAMAPPAPVDEPIEQEQAGGWTVTTSLQWLGEKLPMSPDEASFARKELMSAGYRNENAIAVFVGFKLILIFALAVPVFFVRNSLVSNPLLAYGVVGLAGFIGYALPGFVLSRMVDARRERLRFALADALDLLVVCVEAGQGLDQAIRVVSRELEFTHKDLSEEFSLASLEMRAGTSRSDALMNLALRTGEPEIRKLVNVLIQTDKFGTSVGDALRTHTDYLRVRRTQAAEERAGKVGIKMIFPIFFCILPSIVIVSAGPGVLRLVKTMSAW